LWGAIKGNKAWGSLALGYVEANKPSGVFHAVNCFVTNDGKMYLLEPQNDVCWEAGTKGWSPKFIML